MDAKPNADEQAHDDGVCADVDANAFVYINEDGEFYANEPVDGDVVASDVKGMLMTVLAWIAVPVMVA